MSEESRDTLRETGAERCSPRRTDSEFESAAASAWSSYSAVSLENSPESQLKLVGDRCFVLLNAGSDVSASPWSVSNA